MNLQKIIEMSEIKISCGLSEKDLIKIPCGTTVIGIIYNEGEGVVMAGDRRATMGHTIVLDDIKKIILIDNSTSIGVSGSVGIAFRIAAIFKLTIENFRKINQKPMTLNGKANILSAILMKNFELSLKGLAATPLLAGYSSDENKVKLFSYDILGTKNEKTDFEAIGSGSSYAKDSVKKSYKKNIAKETAMALALEALIEASQEDAATGTIHLLKNIYPQAVTISADGTHELPKEEIAAMCQKIIEEMKRR